MSDERPVGVPRELDVCRCLFSWMCLPAFSPVGFYASELASAWRIVCSIPFDHRLETTSPLFFPPQSPLPCQVYSQTAEDRPDARSVGGQRDGCATRQVL